MASFISKVKSKISKKEEKVEVCPVCSGSGFNTETERQCPDCNGAGRKR